VEERKAVKKEDVLLEIISDVEEGSNPHGTTYRLSFEQLIEELTVKIPEIKNKTLWKKQVTGGGIQFMYLDQQEG